MENSDKKTSFRLVIGSLIGVAAIATVALMAFSPAPEPNIEPAPDFSAIDDVNARKEAFFGYLSPAIKQINQERAEERSRLLAMSDKLAEGRSLNFWDRRHLRRWSERYDVEYEPENLDSAVALLLLHLDQIPGSMVLAQAAMESGWGTSRFAVEGNNYFGQWCFSEGCGLVPARRAGSASHEVRAFDSVEESVRSYFRNINGHAAYTDLREIRAEIRDSGEPLSGLELVEGLQSYSQRGQAYIDELKSVIRFNDLE